MCLLVFLFSCYPAGWTRTAIRTTRKAPCRPTTSGRDRGDEFEGSTRGSRGHDADGDEDADDIDADDDEGDDDEGTRRRRCRVANGSGDADALLLRVDRIAARTVSISNLIQESILNSIQYCFIKRF